MATPLGMAACRAKIAAAGLISQDRAQQIMDEVFDKGERYREAGYEKAYARAAAEIAENKRLAALRARYDALVNANARADIIKNVDGQRVPGEAWHTTVVERLKSMLYATANGDRFDNVQTKYRQRLADMIIPLDRALDKIGASKVAIKGLLDGDVARELWNLNAIGPKQPQGVTGNKTAKGIADAIWPVMRIARDHLNNAGAMIGDAVDYVAHTAHDATKIRAAGGPGADTDQAFRAWWGFTKPRLAEKTFDDLFAKPNETWSQAVDRFGRAVYEGLVTGIHKTADGAGAGLEGGFVSPAFEGSRNLADKHSQARVLFWNDADAWHSYNQRFGRGNTLLETLFHSLDQAAKHSALMEKFGTNPAANLNLVFRSLQEKYRADTDGVTQLGKSKSFLDNVMANLDGRANMPVNTVIAGPLAKFRQLLMGGMLGGVGITHLMSVWPTVPSELAQHGLNRLEAMKGMAEALFTGLNRSEARKDLDAELRSYSAGMMHDMMSRWQPEDTVPGRISTTANIFMKWTGVHYVFDNTQAGIRRMLSNHLARNFEKPFAALEPHMQQMLTRYGLDEPGWNLLRSVKNVHEFDGLKYVTPANMASIGRDEAHAYLKATRRLDERPADTAQPDLFDATTKAQGAWDAKADALHQKVIQEFSDRLGQYYSDAAAHGVITAGVRERAILLQGTRPGTPTGEALRFIAQFKSWPLAAWDQQMRRDFYQSLDGKDYAWNLMTLGAMSMLGGAGRMIINDAAIGNPQRNYADPRVLLAALAQGGGVGIVGDYLFGETSRLGAGIISTAGGPGIADADALWKIYQKFREDASGETHHKNGQFADIWPDLANFGKRHVPFINLIYLKGAVDYLAWYHMMEAISPGWWERSNRALEKERGRPRWGYSPGGGVPYGVPPIYGRTSEGSSVGLLSRTQ